MSRIPMAAAEESLPLDLIGLGQNSVNHLWLVEAYPCAGHKTKALDYRLLPGGQIATAVLTAQRLGLRACYQGAVGDDEWGALACEGLRAEGVRLEQKIIRGAHTQLATIIVDQQGERTIVERYDPQTIITPADLQRQLFCSSRAVHLDLSHLPAALQAAQWAQEAGALVFTDIDGMVDGIERLLAHVDYVIASADVPWQIGCKDPADALYRLQSYGAKGLICITLGAQGCVVLDQQQVLRVPAFEVPITDTTGCGDVFRGAFIYGMLQKWPLSSTLRFASAAAAMAAGALGAQTAIPYLAQVEAFLQAHPLG
jgi:sugar/nucleoside kinase (ribokinase family)